MNLYITKLIPTQVPIIWTAQIRQGLKPARRRMPAWKIRIREERKRYLPLLHAFPVRIIPPVLPEMKTDPDEKAGKPVVFHRYSPLPPVMAYLIQTEEEEYGADNTDATQPD